MYKFENKKHRKYVGDVYFQEVTKTAEGKKHLEKISEPGFSAELSKHAYDDYLHGLDLINQQEEVKKCWTGNGEKDLIPLEPLPWHDGETIDGEKLFRRAKWERQIRQRKNAESEDRFRKNLEIRVKNFMKNKNEEKLNNTRHPPIRKHTLKLLTRPPEPDESIGHYAVCTLKTCTFAYNFISQLIALFSICSAPFLCSQFTSSLPVPAPPAKFRSNASYPFYSVAGTSLIQSCSLSSTSESRSCFDPGYFIQWPYMQLSADSPVIQIPPDLLNKCTLIRGRKSMYNELGIPTPLFTDAGWIWDPFQRTVRSEFLDCSAVCGEGKSCRVPFEHGGTPFHFDNAMYLDNNKLTRTCINTYYLVGGVQSSTVFEIAELARNRGTLSIQDLNVKRCMETACVPPDGRSNQALQYLDDSLSGCKKLDAEAIACSCQPNKFLWNKWLLQNFYPSGSPASLCDSGALKWQPCITDADCHPSGAVSEARCTNEFSGQVPLSQSIKYGCFFASPASTEEMEPLLNTCGAMNVVRKYSNSITTLPALKGQISTQQWMILVFVLKESGYFTAIAITIVIFIMVLCIAIAISPFILLLLVYTRPNSRLQQMLSKIRKEPERLLDIFHIWIFWSISLNLSSITRSVWFLACILARKPNPSIRDFDMFITNTANIIYNLLLIIVFNGDPSGSIVAALIVSVFFLLIQMFRMKIRLAAIASCLADLNEMRLSKFEFALFINKLLEDFLSDDVEYNYVRHFYSDGTDQDLGILKPDIGPIGPNAVEELEDPTSNENLKAHKEQCVFNRLGRHLDRKLAQEFGSDGLGDYANQNPDGVEKYESAKQPTANLRASSELVTGPTGTTVAQV